MSSPTPRPPPPSTPSPGPEPSSPPSRQRLLDSPWAVTASWEPSLENTLCSRQTLLLTHCLCASPLHQPHPLPPKACLRHWDKSDRSQTFPS